MENETRTTCPSLGKVANIGSSTATFANTDSQNAKELSFIKVGCLLKKWSRSWNTSKKVLACEQQADLKRSKKILLFVTLV